MLNRAVAGVRNVGATTKPVSERRVYCAVKSNKHVGLLKQAADHVVEAGHKVVFIDLSSTRRDGGAVDTGLLQGHDIGDLETLGQAATAGDVVLTPIDWGGGPYKHVLSKCQRAGATLVGMVEAGRFEARQYQRVDMVLVWGPSGAKVWPQPTIMTGSPAFENSLAFKGRPKKDTTQLVVNYKFQPFETDTDFAWANSMRKAAQIIDPSFVVSVHPSVKSIPDWMVRSERSIDELLAESHVIITRSSTVVHQAMALDTQVILFTTPDENLAEFADIGDAAAVARNEAELLAIAERYKADGELRGLNPKSFLDWHFSIDPERSAHERIASTVIDVLHHGRKAPGLSTTSGG